MVVAGCGAQSAPPGIALKIVAVNGSVGRAVFHLRCGPAGGDMPDNRAACAALRESPKLVTSPKPFVCAGGTTSWWDVSVSGRIAGRRLDHTVSTCWTPQMAMIGRLGLGHALDSHLVPRRHVRVIPGVQRTIAPGTLRPGDLITCDIRGHRLAADVPTRSDGPTSVGYSGAHVVTVTLEVARDRDGTLLASCHDGDPLLECLAFGG
jgi:hypothetical protein